MKRARQGLARPARLHEDAFWCDTAWGIDYASGERTGDGRAEVWEDFCQAAKTCELTGQRCRLTPRVKAARTSTRDGSVVGRIVASTRDILKSQTANRTNTTKFGH